jgi:hypothetical protein
MPVKKNKLFFLKIIELKRVTNERIKNISEWINHSSFRENKSS